MPAKRNRTKQSQPLAARLLTSAEKARQLARRLPPGKEREMLLRRARQEEVTSELTRFLYPCAQGDRRG